MELGSRLLAGLALSVAVALVALRRGSLSGGGAGGAVLVGTITFGFGGWAWGATLVTFFVLSSLLSRFREPAKRTVAEIFAKGGRRDLGQVLANGGLGALVALTWWSHPDPVLLAAFAGAMATVTADTWATELGVLSRSQPRLVTSWKQVRRGTSGAISVLGTTATVAGAVVIAGLLAAYLRLETLLAPGDPLVGETSWRLIAAASAGGVAGSLADSLLGATVQAIYLSESRQRETERPVAADGTPNPRLRGWQWMDNDWVNFLSSGVGAAAAAGLFVV